jgi:hypothetical protein
MQVVDPIGSAKDFAGDVARARALEPLVKQSGAENLTELAERFVISNANVTTMLIGYSTLDHLEAAAKAVSKGPLPAAIARQMQADRVTLDTGGLGAFVLESDLLLERQRRHAHLHGNLAVASHGHDRGARQDRAGRDPRHGDQARSRKGPQLRQDHRSGGREYRVHP